MITRRQLGAGAAALAASSALPARAQSAGLSADAERALYEAAKKEGEVTWYDAHHAAELAEIFGKKFTEKYPGVKVNVIRTTANVAFQRVTQELKAGGPQCDVLSSTDITHAILLKSQGHAEKFVPANAVTLTAALQGIDKDGFFHVTSIGAIGITLNGAKVKAADAPKRWTDLVDPKWKNQVSVGHPAFSGYVSIWVWEMQRLYGWDYFEKLKANNPQIGRSIQDTLTHLRSGERMVAAGSFATAFEVKGQGRADRLRVPRGRDDHHRRPVVHPEGRQAAQRREAVHGVPVERAGKPNRRRYVRRADPRRGEAEGRQAARRGQDDDRAARPAPERARRGKGEVARYLRDLIFNLLPALAGRRWPEAG